jgi:hypothetical protein
MTHPQRHAGFALLMALVLVLIAGAVLAAIARRSAVAALEARGAVAELKRRWAVASCRRALLIRVGDLLDEPEKGGPDGPDNSARPSARRPMPQMRIPCRLAGQEYLLILTDEQARLNVNRLLDRSPGAAEESLYRFLSNAADHRIDRRAIRLRPTVLGSPGQMPGRSRLNSFGQVLEGASPAELIGEDGGEPGLATWLTCWGDGTVNLHRAPPAVIRQACEGQLSRAAVDAILAARQRLPDASTPQVLNAIAELTAQERAKAMALFTDRPRCFGLWMVTRDPQRSWHAFAVGVKAGPGPREAGAAAELVEQAEFAW